MTIKEALKKYYKIEIDLLLSHILGKPKEFLFMNLDRNLTIKQLNNLTKFIKHRQKGEPMAYILGYKDFYGLRFKVNRQVLIPRPETEMAVDLVKGVILNEAKRSEESQKRSFAGVQDDEKSIKILDIGTGSGNIIISLAKELKKWGKDINVGIPHFYASDISSAALKIAKQNAKNLLGKYSHTSEYESKLPIRFIRSDLLNNIKSNFDIIIANLPYGWKEWKNNTSAATIGLKFEPQEALFTKEKGLMLIRQLLGQVAKRKNQPKIIYLEFDPRQKSDLQKLIKKYLSGRKIKFYKDLHNFWRYAVIF